MKVFRSEKARDAAYAEAEKLSANFGVNHQKLTTREVAEAEPSIRADLTGGLRWTDPWSILDPQSLMKRYLAYFQSLGGALKSGDAATIEHVLEGEGWRIATPDGPLEGKEVVVALGPWADTVTRKLGYRFPLAVKRGYHMHYGAEEGATLNNWVLDAERGYFLAPMLRGIRLTTGAEFARRDTRKTPVQLRRAEKVAREFFPLAGHDAGHRQGAAPCRSVVRLRPCPSRHDARPHYRPGAGGKDAGRAHGDQHWPVPAGTLHRLTQFRRRTASRFSWNCFIA
jgi:D-amino-acid dehydrogenase